MAAVAVDVRDEPSPPRWHFVIAGSLWLVFALLMLSFDSTSAAVIAYIAGALLVLAGVEELVMMLVAPGWRWLHGILGVLFVIGGIAAFFEPFQTFGILALFVGWYLMIKGFFDITTAIAFRVELPLWGLALTVGIFEVLLGLWAVGYPGRSAWLLVIWIGVGALLRGITDLVLAFTHGGAR
jgi:uncharacterized membrane protein HdeD (DUF308 family)